jgi:hypothetical protein
MAGQTLDQQLDAFMADNEALFRDAKDEGAVAQARAKITGIVDEKALAVQGIEVLKACKLNSKEIAGLVVMFASCMDQFKIPCINDDNRGKKDVAEFDRKHNLNDAQRKALNFEVSIEKRLKSKKEADGKWVKGEDTTVRNMGWMALYFLFRSQRLPAIELGAERYATKTQQLIDGSGYDKSSATAVNGKCPLDFCVRHTGLDDTTASVMDVIKKYLLNKEYKDIRAMKEKVKWNLSDADDKFKGAVKTAANAATSSS